MDRFTRWTLATVALVIVAATWVVMSRGEPPPPTGPGAAPAAVATAWFAALADGRPEVAWDLLAPEAQARDSRAEFLRRHPAVVREGPGAARLRVVAAEVVADEARVDVARTHGARADFPFWGGAPGSERLVVRLRRVDGDWRVTSAPEYP